MNQDSNITNPQVEKYLHDLNSDITVLFGYIQLLKEQNSDPKIQLLIEKLHEKANKILESMKQF